MKIVRISPGAAMVNTVRDHYADHLGPVYTWMVGDIDVALSRSAVELDALQLPTKVGGTAVDLGAGFGLHTLPLARRGFSVVAMDTCNSLLQELEARKESLPIRAVNADLLAFRDAAPGGMIRITARKPEAPGATEAGSNP